MAEPSSTTDVPATGVDAEGNVRELSSPEQSAGRIAAVKQLDPAAEALKVRSIPCSPHATGL